MSLSNLYSSARRSLLAYQAATSVTGQNVANAESAGYTRRSARLAADPRVAGRMQIHGPAVGVGGGVGVASIDRLRSALLDGAARRGMTGRDGAGTSAQMLAALEGQLAPDGGTALLGALTRFWNAWSDVADNPADLSARNALLAQAGTVASTLQGASQRLDAFGASARADLGASVQEANGLLAEIAALNGIVRTAHAQGAADPDAQDHRDLLLDRLAGLLPITVRAQADGTVDVSFGGMVGVQGTEARPLRLLGPPDVPIAEIRATGASRALALPASGGILGAGLDVLTVAVPGARASLDALAAQLVARVNEAHAAGTGLDGVSGRPFFDPAGTTAATLALASGMSDPRAIAAGSGAPGDGGVATLIAGLGDGIQSLATALMADLGTRVRAATTEATAASALADHASALRDSVSRVSLDEEMVMLIRYQQAYAASARVLDTANGLFDTLLAL